MLRLELALENLLRYKPEKYSFEEWRLFIENLSFLEISLRNFNTIKEKKSKHLRNDFDFSQSYKELLLETFSEFLENLEHIASKKKFLKREHFIKNSHDKKRMTKNDFSIKITKKDLEKDDIDLE